MKERVLILCTGNSARSQMAEGLLRNMAGERFDIESAGTIATFVRPQAIKAMAEIGIDISHHRSKALTEFLDTPFDHVITVCDDANQTCPRFPGKAKRIHWSIEDPVFVPGSEEDVMNAFRKARDELQGRLQEFCSSVS